MVQCGPCHSDPCPEWNGRRPISSPSTPQSILEPPLHKKDATVWNAYTFSLHILPLHLYRISPGSVSSLPTTFIPYSWELIPYFSLWSETPVTRGCIAGSQEWAIPCAYFIWAHPWQATSFPLIYTSLQRILLPQGTEQVTFTVHCLENSRDYSVTILILNFKSKCYYTTLNQPRQDDMGKTWFY